MAQPRDYGNARYKRAVLEQLGYIAADTSAARTYRAEILGELQAIRELLAEIARDGGLLWQYRPPENHTPSIAREGLPRRTATARAAH